MSVHTIFLKGARSFTHKRVSSVRFFAIYKESIVVVGDSCKCEPYIGLGINENNPSSKADILITDPPYCLLNRRRKSGELRDPKKIVKKVDNQPTVPRYEDTVEYRRFTKQWLSVCIQCGLKPFAPLVIWTNALGKASIIKTCNELSYSLRGEYLWAKRTDTKGFSDASTKNEVLLRVYESALVFQHNSRCPKSSSEIVQQSELDLSLPWSVVTGYHDHTVVYNTAHNNAAGFDKSATCATGSTGSCTSTFIRPHDHPCHKPLAAVEPLVRTWSKPDQLVLDPFSGSGGIALAVIKAGQGRRIKGIELLPEWADYGNSLIASQNSFDNV